MVDKNRATYTRYSGRKIQAILSEYSLFMFACTITACIISQSKIPVKPFNECGDLDHLLQQVVDLILTVAKISTIYEVVGLLSPASIGSVELEVP